MTRKRFSTFLGHSSAPVVASNVDGLFPDHRRVTDDWNGIQFADLAYISRPIIEHMHETRPDAVIAGDRGGRLFAYGALHSWRHRFPDEPFPSQDKKIHFARVTSRGAEYSDVRRVVHFTLASAGIKPDWQKDPKYRDRQPNIVYMDDWACYGGTVERFVQAAGEYGLPEESVTFATMCGPNVLGDRHVIGDPTRNPRTATWNDRSSYAGVSFDTYDGITPTAYPGEDSTHARTQIAESIDTYYSRFDTELAAGRILACECAIDIPSISA